MEKWDLCDILGIENMSKNLCTWNRGTQFSRIDYFLISSHLMNIDINPRILSSMMTDHKLLKLDIKYLKTEKFGNSTWKLNNSLLYDDKFK